MKLITIILVSIMTSLSAMAGGKDCIATEITFQPESIPFTIDWVPDGGLMTFSKAIAWYDEALNFDVIYSGEVGGAWLVAAHWNKDDKSQLIEIHFENNGMKKGILKAGDLRLPFNQMGKFQEYTVECQP